LIGTIATIATIATTIGAADFTSGAGAFRSGIILITCQ
jgi:hypothetical protein